MSFLSDRIVRETYQSRTKRHSSKPQRNPATIFELREWYAFEQFHKIATIHYYVVDDDDEVAKDTMGLLA